MTTNKPLQIEHIGIAVHDMQAAVARYTQLLGCPIGPPQHLEERGISVAFVGEHTPHLELLAPERADSELASFLAKRGEGIHHVCVCVDDLAAAVARLEGHGLRLTAGGMRPGANNSLVAFVHPKDTHGVLLELMQQPVAAKASEAEA